MSLLAIVGGVVMTLLQLWGEYLKSAPARKVRRDALVDVELDELDASMRVVDDGVRKQP